MHHIHQSLLFLLFTTFILGCGSESDDSPLVPEVVSIEIVDANTTLAIHSLPLTDINGNVLDLNERQLQVSISYTEGPDTTDANELNWESSDPSVITVHNGLLTPVANEGSALISASYRDILYTTIDKNVTIIPLTDVNISSETIDINSGHADVNTSSTYTLAVNGTFVDGNISLAISSNADWNSSNTTVATVDLTGILTTFDEGNSTVEVSLFNEVNSSLELNVTAP